MATAGVRCSSSGWCKCARCRLVINAPVGELCEAALSESPSFGINDGSKKPAALARSSRVRSCPPRVDIPAEGLAASYGVLLLALYLCVPRPRLSTDQERPCLHAVAIGVGVVAASAQLMTPWEPATPPRGRLTRLCGIYWLLAHPRERLLPLTSSGMVLAVASVSGAQSGRTIRAKTGLCLMTRPDSQLAHAAC